MPHWSSGSQAAPELCRPRTVEEIVARTDGVPLFIEELTKAMIEAGVTANSRPLSPAMVGVPATLHASLMARLDRLGTAAKQVAQAGAAIGREFGHDLLAAIADLPDQRSHVRAAAAREEPS